MSRQARERREPEPPRLMELVKVGRANNQAEAEFLQGLLLEEGVPSVVQRGQGSDVPDFLAAGARDLLVSRENAQVARDDVEALAAILGVQAHHDRVGFPARTAGRWCWSPSSTRRSRRLSSMATPEIRMGQATGGSQRTQ
jgi:hypothetical protein